jgi:hypothetical protein
MRKSKILYILNNVRNPIELKDFKDHLADFVIKDSNSFTNL